MATGNVNPWLGGIGSGLRELSQQLLQIHAMNEEKKQREEERKREDSWRERQIGREDARFRVLDERYADDQLYSRLKDLPGGSNVSPEIAGAAKGKLAESFLDPTFKLQSPGVPDTTSEVIPGVPMPTFSGAAMSQGTAGHIRRMRPEDYEFQAQQKMRELQMSEIESNRGYRQRQEFEQAGEKARLENALKELSGYKGDLLKMDRGLAGRLGILDTIISAEAQRAINGQNRSTQLADRRRAEAQNAFNDAYNGYIRAANVALSQYKSMLGDMDPMAREEKINAFMATKEAEADRKARAHVSQLYPEFKQNFTLPELISGGGTEDFDPNAGQNLALWDKSISDPRDPFHSSAQSVNQSLNTLLSQGPDAARANVDALRRIAASKAAASTPQFKPFWGAALARIDKVKFMLDAGQDPSSLVDQNQSLAPGIQTPVTGGGNALIEAIKKAYQNTSTGKPVPRIR
jgi:hypothetical protein